MSITEKYQKLLANLTVAKEYLSLSDIKELIDLNDNDINQMKYDKELTRWFSTIYKENVYFAFKHQIISKAFSKIMPNDVKKAEENIIKYCSNWEKNKSKYAICHYAEHLFDKLLYDKVYELVREESCLKRQEELGKKEFQLPLNTIQFAIKSAIREDDPEKNGRILSETCKILDQ